MPFGDVSSLRVTERLPGWRGRYFHSASMTFTHYDFMRGASFREHFHLQDEVYEVIAGVLEITIDAVAQIVPTGLGRDRAGRCSPFDQSIYRRQCHHR